jgi:multiple sugar transport system ATP-binding protein
MASIGFESVTKQFGETVVLKDFTLEVRPGELMVLVGPSGCGKSTALRLVAGLEHPSLGRLTIDGRDMADVAPKDRNVAMVFQNYALYPHMTVEENIGFGLSIRGRPSAEIAARVGAAAETLGLSTLLNRKPAALSGGQRQRVALGRALVRSPAVFLFDEPLSNLDAELRVQMRAEIARLQQTLGTTSLYVTHDQVEAMTLGHRIAVLAPLATGAGGNLMQVGAPLELYDDPDNAFVAQFMGAPAMNLLPGTVGTDTVDGSGFRLPLGGALAHLVVHPGRPVLIGIRPEHVHEVGQLPVDRAIRIEAPVEIAESVGAESLIHVAIAGRRLIARLPSRRVPAFGTPLSLELDAARLYAFDAKSGLRIRRGA